VVRPHAVAEAPALLQLRRAAAHSRSSGGGKRQQVSVASFLESKAQILESSSLAQVVAALRGSAGNATEETGSTDHFVHVRGIIKDLIAQLEAEALAEADSKSFCDKEMAAAVAKRDEQKAEVESLKAKLEATQADIQQLGTSISQLSVEIADLYKALKEMAAIRQEEQQTNNNTIVDADAGAQAVGQAIALLKGFYEKPAFLQKGAIAYHPTGGDRSGNTVADLAPETFSGEYEGKLAESKGIIGVLELIQGGLERTSSSTAALEEQQEGDYQKQKKLNEDDIGAKKKDKTDAETSKGLLETELFGLEDSVRDAEKLHEGAIEELEKLRPMCIDSSMSYAERRRKRQEEIEALREAMKILQDWQS